MSLRYRGKSDFPNIVKNLDGFQRLPEAYKKSSLIGGALSVVSYITIILLIRNELSSYQMPGFKFTFRPDANMDEKLKIQVDLMIASPCQSISTDIVDSTDQSLNAFGTLKEDDVHWQLCRDQRDYFESIRRMNNFLRKEYHSLTDVIFKNIISTGEESSSDNLPRCSREFAKPYDACRIHGSLLLNKVAGNLHVTAGQSIHFGQGHIHIRNLFGDHSSNFSHRIHKLSFGDMSSKLIQPLEGNEKYFNESSTKAMYVIEIVPTEIQGFFTTTRTFQYSVKRNFKPIDNGHPGIYISYDFSALRIIIAPNRENLFSFLIRLCSIISGIVIISGMIKFALESFCEKIAWFLS